MTILPTAPPFPAPNSAQADLMFRELYTRVQTLETTIRTVGGGGDGDEPQDPGFLVLNTTPVRMLSKFVHRSRGLYNDGFGERNELVGILNPGAIVLSVTASIAEVFEITDLNVRFLVGTTTDHPDVPEGSGNSISKLFFAHSQFGQQNLAPFRPWVAMGLRYEWASDDKRQGVDRFLVGPTATKVFAQWEDADGTGNRFGTGNAHVVVLYVDSNPGAAVESLTDVTLVRPLPPGS